MRAHAHCMPIARLIPGIVLTTALAVFAAGVHAQTVDDRQAVMPSSGGPHDAMAAALGDRQMLARLTQGAMRKFKFLDAPRPIAEFRIAAVGGQPTSPAAWRGRVLLLNVWASWCAPCREEMPALDRLRTRFAADGLAVVTLSIDKTSSEPIAFLAGLGLSDLPLLLDPAMEATKSLGVAGAPTSILIDANGRELGRIEGAADWDSVEAMLLVKAMVQKAATAVRAPLPTPTQR